MPSISPSDPSKSKTWLRWLTAIVVIALIAVFAGRSIKARQARNAAATASAKAPLSIELSPADLAVARPLPLTRTLAVSGGLKAAQTAVVKAKVAAEVKTLSVREGDAVKAGQTIGRLDTTELDWRVRQAEQTASAAKAQLDIARRALDNNRALVAQGFISPTSLEASVSNAASADANHQAAAAAAALARKARADAVLVAPISGVVSQRLVQPGERVAVDARIVEIVDLSRIELEAAVAPEDVVEVRVGQHARLVVDGLPQPAFATVERINPSTQPGTRAVMVYLALQGHAGLRQGLFATGHVELQSKTALVVPASAVRIDQARPRVLVLQDGKVVQRVVTLGTRGEASFDGRTEDAIEITSGVSDGMTLLRATAGSVRDGTPAKVLHPLTPTAPSAGASRPPV